jgi:glucose/arabinose dehydrogenase
VKRFLGVTEALVFAWLLGSCGDGPVQPQFLSVASVTLSADTATLVPSGTIQLSATAVAATGESIPRIFSWSTSDATKATVSKSGAVIGVAPGVAIVTATTGGKSASTTITVLDGGVVTSGGGTLTLQSGKVQLFVPAGALASTTSLSVAPSRLFAGDARVLAAFDFGPPGTNFTQPVELKMMYDPTSLPSGAEEAALELYSHTSSGWQVISQSSVDLTAKVVSASVPHFSTYGILVPEAVAGIAIGGPSSLTVGESAQMTAALTAADGRALSNRVVTWSSSDATVASVSSTGGVQALKPGSTTVTASAGGKTSSVVLTIDPIAVAALTISAPTTPISIGATQVLTATPRDATGAVLVGRTVSWSSSNPTVLTVTAASSISGPNGATVTVQARCQGMGTITATAGSVRATTAAITVVFPLPEPVATVTVSPASVSLVAGNTRQMTAVARDEAGNVLSGREIRWSSSNAAVATVDELTGLVTAVNAGGPVTVTATSEGKAGTSSITVTSLTIHAIPFITSGLSAPVFLAQPLNDGRIFVVEQTGRIRVIRDGVLQSAPFLDLTAKVKSGGEQGLLSAAFHPQYTSNHYFYVYFTGLAGEIRIERFTTTSDPSVADPSSGKVIFTTAHSDFSNHNGGLVAFGPDGMLYAALGDGGSSGDPLGNSQNFDAYLGGMIRIDVDHGDPYSIPSDNPFVGQVNRKPELWSKGLRNPWRFAFDALTGLLFIADVGQTQREEVNAVPAAQGGLNYGWNIMEGFTCYFVPGECNQTGLQLPVLEYPHTGACSVTGGYVYRGSAMPAVRGHYFYSDYCGGWLKSLRIQNGIAVDRRDWGVALSTVTSFGQDATGELYMTSGDAVYKLVPGS